MRSIQFLATFAIVSAGFFQGEKLEQFKEKVFNANPFEAGGSIRDDAFDLWTPSEIHEWLSYHKINPPDVKNTGSLVALARENKDKLLADIQNVADDVQDKIPPSEKILNKGAEYFQQASDSFFNTWSDSALANFLSDRGEDTKNVADHDKLVELANKYKGVAIDTKNQVSRAWFDSWSREDLEATLKDFGSKVEGSRQQLADELYKNYLTAKDSAIKGEAQGEKTAQNAIKTVEQWRKDTFDRWSLDDLKEYLSQFGPSQPSTKDQLVAAARSQWNYFVYGKESPTGVLGHLTAYANSVANHVQGLIGDLKSKLLSTKEDL